MRYKSTLRRIESVVASGEFTPSEINEIELEFRKYEEEAPVVSLGISNEVEEDYRSLCDKTQ